MEAYSDYNIRIEKSDGGCIAWASRIDGQMMLVDHNMQYEVGTVRLASEREALVEIKALIDSGDLRT